MARITSFIIFSQTVTTRLGTLTGCLERPRNKCKGAEIDRQYSLTLSGTPKNHASTNSHAMGTKFSAASPRSLEAENHGRSPELQDRRPWLLNTTRASACCSTDGDDRSGNITISRTYLIRRNTNTETLGTSRRCRRRSAEATGSMPCRGRQSYGPAPGPCGSGGSSTALQATGLGR